MNRLGKRLKRLLEEVNMTKNTTLCVGCRDNFYNGNNSIGVSECWSLKTARVVFRWRLHWWTAPTASGAFVQVKTYDCHHEPGQYAFEKELPDHAVKPVCLEEATP